MIMKKILSILALAGLVATSCVKEEPFVQFNPEEAVAPTLAEVTGTTLSAEAEPITTLLAMLILVLPALRPTSSRFLQLRILLLLRSFLHQSQMEKSALRQRLSTPLSSTLVELLTLSLLYISDSAHLSLTTQTTQSQALRLFQM